MPANREQPRGQALERPDGSWSESRLLGALRGGSRAAAEELVDRTYEMVFASLFKLTGGDRELAEDLTQDAYARAWRSVEGFDGRSKFGTWLYRIAYNTFLNHIRRPARVRSFEEGEEERLQDEADNELDAAEREEGQFLRRAVVGLPEELRFAVSARYWGGLSLREIAEAQGVSAPAVRKRLARAYTTLALEMETES